VDQRRPLIIPSCRRSRNNSGGFGPLAGSDRRGGHNGRRGPHVTARRVVAHRRGGRLSLARSQRLGVSARTLFAQRLGACMSGGVPSQDMLVIAHSSGTPDAIRGQECWGHHSRFGRIGLYALLSDAVTVNVLVEGDRARVIESESGLCLHSVRRRAPGAGRPPIGSGVQVPLRSLAPERLTARKLNVLSP
jgi:hypothetical protein